MDPLRPILLVEDNAHDVELSLAALRKNHFANPVVVLRDGAEALDYLFRRDQFEANDDALPIVVFLDLKMPKVDGLEVLKHLKGDERLKSVPVVILTSSREESDLVKSYRTGANAYVVKPVDFTQFVDAIKQAGMFWAIINEPPPSAVT